MKLGEIQRPLRPTREERKKIPAQNLSQMKVDVIVNIASAMNVPTRADEAGVSWDFDQNFPNGLEIIQKKKCFEFSCNYK